MNTNLPLVHLLRFFALLTYLACTASLAIGQNTARQPEGAKAGHIVVGSGHLTAKAIGGAERRLHRRSPIYAGDTIIVGKNAFVQIRFSDGALFSLRPGSEFRISEYRHQEQADENGKAVFELLKGGLRTISGTIGKKKQENYQLNTPISTIGIRGTHYGTRLCAGDCRTPEGDLMPDGQYGGVVDGAISVTPRADGPGRGQGQRLTRGFGNDSYFHLAHRGAPIQELLGPPGILFGQPQVQQDKKDQSEQGSKEPGGAGHHPTQQHQPRQRHRPGPQPPPPPPPSPPPPPPPPPDLRDNLGLTQNPPGSAIAVAGILLDTDGPVAEVMRAQGDPNTRVYLDNVGGVGNVPVRVIIHDPEQTSGCNPECGAGRGTATLVDHNGFGSAADGVIVNWGRWSGGWNAHDASGAIPTAGSLHYIYSPHTTPAPDLETLRASGTVGTYAHIAGGAPTDQNNNAGIFVIGNTIMTLDFGSAEITGYDVEMTGFGTGITLSGSLEGNAPISLLDTDGHFKPGANFQLGATCSGGACATGMAGKGSVGMALTGKSASHAINSVEMHTNDMSQSAVGTFVSKR